MSIIMAVAGVIVGAIMGAHLEWRSNVAKERQQLESKTTYDYALTNAINERDRLQGELVTIQALKRTEADTERIRNEIGTILSEDGEGASESSYERNIGMPIQDNGDGTICPITWDNRISSEEMSDNITKAFAKAYGTNVREDGTEDERMAEDDVERSLINDIKDKASENLELAVEFAKMTVQDDEAIRNQLEETSKEMAEETRELRRGIREFKEEGKYYGETLYGKGSR